MIEITVNGETKQLAAAVPLGQFLEDLDVRETILLVERNGELLKKDRFDETKISDGDVLELIRLVGGG